MKARFISLPALHLFQLFGLIRAIELFRVEISGRGHWQVVASSRWTKRVLLDDPFFAPNLIVPTPRPSPRLFSTRDGAVEFLHRSGLQSVPHAR